MEAEAFFDDLYDHYCLAFPCFALVRNLRRGCVAECANDGTLSLVVLTDEDLLRRYRKQKVARTAVPYRFDSPEELRAFLRALPAQITHVTFDPTRRFHRRYPVSALLSTISPAAN